MATDYTTHYNLDKYTATDKPNLRDQYNAAMDKIDAALWSQGADAADAKNIAQSALQQVAGKVSQSELNAAIAPLATKEELNNKIPTDLLLFGDSWTDRAQGFPDWIPYVTDELNFDNVYNYAIGGAGWTVGTTITTQINRAASALTEAQKNKVSTIIIFALVNDMESVTSEDVFTTLKSGIRIAMQACYNSLKNDYPNAKIYIIPNFAGGMRGNSLQQYKYCVRFNKFMSDNGNVSFNVPYVQDFCNIFTTCQDTDMYEQYGLHLNNNGAAIVGSAIKNMLKGMPNSEGVSVHSTLTSGSDTIAYDLLVKNNFAFFGTITNASLIEANAQVDYTLNKQQLLYKQLCANFLSQNSQSAGYGLTCRAINGPGTEFGYVQIRPDFSLRFKATTAVPANTPLYFYF